MTDRDDIEAVRGAMVKAGFPAEHWTDDELVAKWKAILEGMVALRRALLSVFRDLEGRFSETFRRLQVIAEEIDSAEGSAE